MTTDETQKVSQGVLSAQGVVLGVSEETLSDLETASRIKALAAEGRCALSAVSSYFDAKRPSEAHKDALEAAPEAPAARNATPISLAAKCLRFARTAASFLAKSALAGQTDLSPNCSSECCRGLAELLDVIFMIDIMKQANVTWQQELGIAIAACQDQMKASTSEALTSFMDDNWGAVQLFRRGLDAMPLLPNMLKHLLLYIRRFLHIQDGSCLLLPAERSMLHRALAVTVFLLFPGGSPKNSLQRVGQSVLLDSIRLLRAQPVVLGWADCKAIWLLSLPALSPYLCSLGPEHGKAYQLSPASEIGSPASSLHPSCSPVQQLPSMRVSFQKITEQLWSLSVRAKAPQLPDCLGSNQVAEETFVTATLPRLTRQGNGSKRDAAKLLLQNMRSAFKSKVSGPSRKAFARSRTLFPTKRMRAGSPEPALLRPPDKMPKLDSDSTEAMRTTTDEETLSEGQAMELGEKATRQVAPSEVQMHALLQYVEQLLQELQISGGKQVMGAAADPNARTDLIAFQQLLLQWPLLSNLQSSACKAADLGSLGLRASPSGPEDLMDPGNLESLLPWQLAREGLEHPAGGPCELCLGPLRLFRDAARLAESMGAGNAVADAASDARTCLEALMKLLARQVFDSHMALAADELTERGFLDLCAADHARLFPALAVPRQFQGLFRTHRLALPDGDVSFNAMLSLAVQGCFEQASRCLLNDFEASDVSGVIALDALHRVLQRSHQRLSAHLLLDPWEQTWDLADGDMPLQYFQSRAAKQALRQLKGVVLSSFTFCLPTQRFARLLPPPRDAQAVGASWSPELGRLYGVGGIADGVFSSWVDLHNGFVGREHLAAFLHLAGNAGAAALVEQLGMEAEYACNHMISPGLTGLMSCKCVQPIMQQRLKWQAQPDSAQLQHLAETASEELNVAASKDAKKTYGTKRLLPLYLTRIQSTLDRICSSGELTVLDGKTFVEIWSRLLTLHLASSETSAGAQISSWSSKGDGLLQGAAIMLHLLDQAHAYKLRDITTRVLSSCQAVHPSGRTTSSTGKNGGEGPAAEVQVWQQQAERAVGMLEQTLQGCAQALPKQLPPAVVPAGGHNDMRGFAPESPEPWKPFSEAHSTSDQADASRAQDHFVFRATAHTPQPNTQARPAVLQTLEASRTSPEDHGRRGLPSHVDPQAWPSADPLQGQITPPDTPTSPLPSDAATASSQATPRRNTGTTATPHKPLDWESFLIPASYGTPPRDGQGNERQPSEHVRSSQIAYEPAHPERFPAIPTAFDGLPREAQGSIPAGPPPCRFPMSVTAARKPLPDGSIAPGADTQLEAPDSHFYQSKPRSDAPDTQSGRDLSAAALSRPDEGIQYPDVGDIHTSPGHAPASPARVLYPMVDPVGHDHRQASQFRAAMQNMPEPAPSQGRPQPSTDPTPRPGDPLPQLESRQYLKSRPTEDTAGQKYRSDPTGARAEQQLEKPPQWSLMGGDSGQDDTRPSAPQFPDVDGASMLDEPMPGSPVVEIKSLVKYPAIANGSIAARGFNQLSEARAPLHPNRPITPQRLLASTMAPSAQTSPVKPAPVDAGSENGLLGRSSVKAIQYSPELVPAEGEEVLSQLAAPIKSVGKDPAGWIFHAFALKQSGLFDEPEKENTEKSKKDLPRRASLEDDQPPPGVEWKGKKKKKKDKQPDKLDLYGLLGLNAERWTATDNEIKLAYRKTALEHHPDKKGAATADEETKKAIEQHFTLIQDAYETLSDPAKRREYDSVDDFDDTLPYECQPADFFKVFAPAFRRNSRWSEAQPVPQVGDDDTPYKEVDKFYNFWFSFKSWREFPHPDEEDVEQAESREERRWIERYNKKLREAAKKEDARRLKSFVGAAESCDPRMLRRAAEQKAERERRKQERESVTRKRFEDKEKAEVEEAAKKAAEEAKAAEDAAEARKQRQKEKKVLQKERSRLRGLCTACGGISDWDMECLTQQSLEDLQSLSEQLSDEGLSEQQRRHLAQDKLGEMRGEEAAEREARQAAQAAAAAEEEKAKKREAATKAARTRTSWDEEEIRMLEKALEKFPQGTAKRWEQVSQYVRTRTQDEVVEMAAAGTPAGGKPSGGQPWNEEQELALVKALKLFGKDTPQRWEQVAKSVPGKSKSQCQDRFKALRATFKEKKAT
ncbi:hypothetical protein WJX84_011390 [Apatococcus fuscideae]|uniref:DnaJ homolog subfamily C member 2 n=1 Tax=Apatococcus fuscideae TaxID=2026836 RepID=A0AAW1T1T5_9CHLO